MYIYVYISISKFVQGLAVHLGRWTRFWGIGITLHFGGLFRTGKLWLKSRQKPPTGTPKSTKNRSRTSFFNLQRLWETRRRKVNQKSPSRAVPEANIWCSVRTERHFSVFLLDPRKPAEDFSRASRWDLKCTRVSSKPGKIASRNKLKKARKIAPPKTESFKKMTSKWHSKFKQNSTPEPKLSQRSPRLEKDVQSDPKKCQSDAQITIICHQIH